MIVFLIFFIFFLFYIPPLINFSDGAEFAISFYSLGISHPPSYPLFVNVSRLLYYIPLGNIYIRLCIFTVLISSLIFFVIWRFYKGSILQKSVLSIFLLSCESFFENTLIGEVYGLNLLFFVLIFFSVDKIKNKKFFYLIFFLLGLGIGNHHSIILLMPYIFLVIYSNRSLFNFKDIALSSFLLMLGFSVYLYLPFRAIKDPMWNWGNPKNLIFFMTNFFRSDFSNKGILRPIEHFVSQLTSLNPVYEIGVINTLITIIALVILFFKNRKKFTKILFIVFCYSVLLIIAWLR